MADEAICHRDERRIRDLEYWRDGNGARGAEQRLQTIEKMTTAILVMVGVTFGKSIVDWIITLL